MVDHFIGWFDYADEVLRNACLGGYVCGFVVRVVMVAVVEEQDGAVIPRP